MQRPRYFEDFEPGATYDLGSVVVEQDEMLAFAKRFDPIPFHTDPQAATESTFGGLIASGWHTGSMFMRLFVDGLIGAAANMGSPGMEEVRFFVPVRPGDTLTGRYLIERADPSERCPDRGKVLGTGELVNQDGEVVFRIRNRSYFQRRPEGDEAEAELVRGLP